MEGIAWRWQSIDGAMFKAPMAQESAGPNPTDRGKKKGSKRHLMVDGRGVPLSLVVTSLSEILCVRHTMTIRSMYAKQDEAEECSHCREIGGAAEDSPGVA
jgi:hypothetical protein